MSHEALIPGKMVYTVPVRPSDMLRTIQFTQFFRHYRGTPFAVRTQDGWSWLSAAARPPVFTATFSSRDRLDAVVGDAAESSLARAFLDGDLDIQGDFSTLLSVAEYTLRHSEGLNGTLVHALGRFSLDLSRRLRPARKSAAPNWRTAPCPLDLPVSFFEPWLGSLLSHACASFGSGHADAEAGACPDPESPSFTPAEFTRAQLISLDRVCRALHIQPGDRLLDMACGWGALALRAAQAWEADALGIASCEVQADAARERILAAARSGRESMVLTRRCSAAARDLRSSPFRSEIFDKITDISLFEQVPSADLPEYFTSMASMLVPGGLLLIDRITRSAGHHSPKVVPLRGELSFEPLSREIEAAESAGFELIAVESLQSDFDLTVRLWIRSLRRISRRDLAPEVERAYRAWLLWLVETAANLQAAGLHAHRLLLRRAR